MFMMCLRWLRQSPLLPPPLLGLLCLGGPLQCSKDESPETFLTLRELDAPAQPTSSALGVLVAVTARGGDLVRLDVSGGTVEFRGTDLASPLCIEIPNAHFGTVRRHWVRLNHHNRDEVSAFVVAVHPADQEAVVNATLGRQSFTVAGVGDAGIQDGGAPGLGNYATVSCDHGSFSTLDQFATLVVSLGRASSGSLGVGGSTAQGGGSTGGEPGAGAAGASQTSGNGGSFNSASSGEGGSSEIGGTSSENAGTAGEA